MVTNALSQEYLNSLFSLDESSSAKIPIQVTNIFQPQAHKKTKQTTTQYVQPVVLRDDMTVSQLLELYEKDLKIALSQSKKNYLPPCDIWHLEDKVKDILSIGNQTGEGWFLTAEMVEYIEHDIPNIVCVQPFACLPNHIVGKGVIKTIREKYPNANISAVDYDPGASESNQTNRIKLLMTVAKDNLTTDKNQLTEAKQEVKNN